MDDDEQLFRSKVTVTHSAHDYSEANRFIEGLVDDERVTLATWSTIEAEDTERSLYQERALVYIAGPYTSPDPCVNTNAAIMVANELTDICVPLIPHLSHFWHTVTPRPYEFWTEMDFVYLSRCDALLRLPGASPGADAEVDAAGLWAIPVFFDVASTRAWVKDRGAS